MTAITRQRLFDGFAIGTSALCLVHCVVLPALLLLVPALTAVLALPESFHVGMLAFAVPTSILATAIGYRRHRWSVPALIVVPGILLLALGALAAPERWIETLLTIVGAVLIVSGHVLNWRAVQHAALASSPASETL